MKKKVLILSLLMLTLSTASISVNALEVDNVKKGIITVNTKADKEVMPDTAEISFAVKTYDLKSMDKAAVLNREISKNVLEVLKTFVVSSKGDYIKTADYSANPIYSYVNSKKTFEKYEVTNRIIIRTKSIDKLGLMIDKAIAAGATNVDNLSFTLADYETLCNELLVSATKKAKTRADMIANALSTSIIGLDKITTSCSSDNQAPRLYMAKNMIADVASGASESSSSFTQISNGMIKINANVQTSFIVK